MDKLKVGAWLLLVIMSVSAVYADNSCRYARDGKCDVNSGDCLPFTDDDDCSVTDEYNDDSLSINDIAESLRERLDYNQMDLEFLNDGYGVTPYSILLCGKYIQGSNEIHASISESQLKATCQNLGGCECDTNNGTYRALAMKPIDESTAEVLTWFESGNVIDVSDKRVLVTAGHIHASDGAKANMLNAQVIRESLRLNMSFKYNTNFINDTLMIRPSHPFGKMNDPKKVYFEGRLISVFDKTVSRYTGLNAQWFVDFRIIPEHKLTITASQKGGANSTNPKSLTLDLKTINQATLNKVSQFVDNIATGAGWQALHKQAEPADVLPAQWTPAGLVSVQNRLNNLAEGAKAFKQEHLLETGRAWAWLSLLDSKIAPLLATERAARAIAFVSLANGYEELSSDAQALVSLAQAGAYADIEALGLLKGDLTFPEIKALSELGTFIPEEPNSEQEYPAYQGFSHAYNLMANTEHYDRARRWMFTATNQGSMLVDTMLMMSAFNESATTMSFHRGKSDSLIKTAFEQLLDNLDLADASGLIDNYGLLSLIDAGAGLYLIPDLIEGLATYTSTVNPTVDAHSLVASDEVEWVRELIHRLSLTNRYKFTVWNKWGNNGSVKNRLAEIIPKFSIHSYSTPEMAYALAIIGDERTGNQPDGWQSGFNALSDSVGVQWASAYPSLEFLFGIADQGSAIELSWIASGLDAPRVKNKLMRKNLFIGSLAALENTIPPSDYMINYTKDLPWWMDDSWLGDIGAERYKNQKVVLYRHNMNMLASNRDGAIKGFVASLARLEMRHDDTVNKLVELYKEDGAYAKAVELEQQFVDSNPQGFLQLSDAQQTLAFLLLNNKQYQKGYEQAVIAAESGSARSYGVLILNAIMAKKFDVAKETITRGQKHYGSRISLYASNYLEIAMQLEQRANIDAAWGILMTAIKNTDPNDATIENNLFVFLRVFDLMPRFVADNAETANAIFVRAYIGGWLTSNELEGVSKPWLVQLDKIKSLTSEVSDPWSGVSYLANIDYTAIPAQEHVKKAWNESFKTQMTALLLSASKQRDETVFQKAMTLFQAQAYWHKWNDDDRPFELTAWAQEAAASEEQLNWLSVQYRGAQKVCKSCDLLKITQSMKGWEKLVKIDGVFGTTIQTIAQQWFKGETASTDTLLSLLLKYADDKLECGTYNLGSVLVLTQGTVDKGDSFMQKHKLSTRCMSDAKLGRFTDIEYLSRSLYWRRQMPAQ
jgi:hypothetical protein